MSETKYSRSFRVILEGAVYVDQVSRKDLKFGDFVLVVTQNSTYLLSILQDAHYLVSGGWFDRNGFSPIKLQINGCTWGGKIIKVDIVAACGMHLEFSNGILTSKIQEVIVLNGDAQN